MKTQEKSPEIIEIPKLSAAQRQVSEAILLFLQQRDVVAIHSLTSAAHQVLSDIATAKGQDTIIKNNPRLTTDPGLRKEFYRRINEAFNFMKHADNDPDGVLEFRPKVTPFMILDCVLIYWSLMREVPWVFQTFLVWYSLNHPGTLFDGVHKDAVDTYLADGGTPNDFDVLYELAIRGPL